MGWKTNKQRARELLLRLNDEERKSLLEDALYILANGHTEDNRT